MTYIVGVIVVGLFFLALHYLTDVTFKQKIAISATTLLIILSAIAFNSYTDNQRDKMMNVVMKFNQNSTITCDGIDVNSTNFTLSIGTYTFIGKEKTPFYGQMISVSKCQ
ncbi:conserved hypothetical protein [Sulfurimonas denitrificans DSM 1251]|jgi:hypothetical protein|uniref:Uncharacterized protein n=1 Tax=Sulfurimonas denitrificans (strain ATCC 33889 / DSM 1251) TaxID=326298 RepID=Q30SJ6_SULDN|nr:hypothetical protein [Sulfurimonas denitrificans]ABB44035.1 conserved hypothetical protein [Sulfurimonas denitrificans DSM 1251]MDD3443395.1 hypothetical protein [Sulfurimonas denitrificans]